MNENTLQFLADILVEWGSAGAVGAILATILCRHFGKRWIDSKFPEGDLVEYDHMGYASRYERNLLISVENGVVVGTRILSDEAYQKELESQAPSPELPRSLWARLWRVVASQRS